MVDKLGRVSHQPLISHRVVKNHAEDGERFVDRAAAQLHVICALLRARLGETGFRLQKASDERLSDGVGNPLAQLRSKAFNVRHLDQAELAVTEIGEEIADKELLVAATRGGPNPDLTLEPSIGHVIEGTAALVYQTVRYLGQSICQQHLSRVQLLLRFLKVPFGPLDSATPVGVVIIGNPM